MSQCCIRWVNAALDVYIPGYSYSRNIDVADAVIVIVDVVILNVADGDIVIVDVVILMLPMLLQLHIVDVVILNVVDVVVVVVDVVILMLPMLL